MTDLILETHGLTKEFVGFFAVRDVALKVRRGSIHAVGDGGDLRADLPPRRDRGDRALFQARTLSAAPRSRIRRIVAGRLSNLSRNCLRPLGMS